MFAENRNNIGMTAAAVVLALALIVGGQFLANRFAPESRQLSQGTVIGQAGFAYLGGLRMMGAGLLMARVDPQWHQYGQTAHFERRLDILPTIRLVQLLNPQLEQPYYDVSYVLWLRGQKADALALAKEGIKNNPTSGLLRANYAQLLFMQNRHKNVDLMLEQARVGLGPTATYNSVDDQFEAYGVFRAVYHLAGDTAMVAKVDAMQKQLAAMRPAESPGSPGLLGLLQAWSNSATSKE